MQEAEVDRLVRVRAVVDLPGVPKGTLGIITDLYPREPFGEKGQGVEVTWQVTGAAIIDGFAPHELQHLEVVHDDG